MDNRIVEQEVEISMMKEEVERMKQSLPKKLQKALDRGLNNPDIDFDKEFDENTDFARGWRALYVGLRRKKW